MVELEDEAHVPISKLHQRCVVQRFEIRVGDDNLSGVGSIESAQQMEQGALAHTGRANDRHHLAIRHMQLEIAEHVDALRTQLVHLVQALNVYERHANRT